MKLFCSISLHFNDHLHNSMPITNVFTIPSQMSLVYTITQTLSYDQANKYLSQMLTSKLDAESFDMGNTVSAG